MKTNLSTIGALAGAALFAVIAAAPANALSIQECSAKYSAAKADGSLGGKSWNDFQRSECAIDAKTAGKPATTAAKPAKTEKSAKSENAKPVAPAAKASTATNSSGAVFPKTIASIYAKESAGKARLHTCLDQYKTNKSTNANGGLEWIQKGGGYYSQCNKQLKG